MAVKLQIKRGLEAGLDSLGGVSAGEFKYATDTERVYIGNGSTNKVVGGADVVFKNDEQILTNKTINADNNALSNLQPSHFKGGTVKASIAGDFYYGYENISATQRYVYTKSKSAGITEVFSITFDSNDKATVITSIGYGTIASNEKLTLDSIEYNRKKDNDGYQVIDSANKMLNLDVVFQIYNKAIADAEGSGGGGETVTSVIEVVTELPTEHDQTKLYKLQGTECIYWYNGTEYIDISSESEMLEVTAFPTSDIRSGRLYKLTQNITHLDTAKFLMVGLSFTESTTTVESAYTYNPNTGKWYYDVDEITVLTPSALPEPEASIRNNYYYVDGQLYQCQYTRPVVIDYYAGIYAYMNQGWRALYTENLMVDYNTGISPLSLPKINNKYVKGEHGIDYYGGLTESYADGKYQTKEMANPLTGYTATTVEGTLAEINTKISSATRICGQVPTYEDLPTGASAGDMYVVKDYTDTEEVVHHNILFCWNGVDWFEYGSADIDMSPYQKWEQKIDSFKAANPNLTFSDASSVAMNDEFTLARLEITLNSPVTDIQSPDRTIINIPSDVEVSDGMINAEVLTHAGQFTCQENVPDLPSDVVAGYKKGVVNYAIAAENVHNFLRLKTIRAVERDVELLNVWYEKYNDEYYYNGTKITVNIVSELPEPVVGNVGNYYATTQSDANARIYLSESVDYVTQDVNQATGELMYDSAGMPSVKSKYQLPPPYIFSGDSLTIWVFDTHDILPAHEDFIVGYDEVSVEAYMTGEPKTVNAPRLRVKLVTLTANHDYILACRRLESELFVNEQGVWGRYSVTESDESKQYMSHEKSSANNLRYGINGTFIFTPENNDAKIQPIRAYIENGKIKVDGTIPFDKIYITTIMH